MGVATGGGGGDGVDLSPWFEILGRYPPEIAIFTENFMHFCQNFQIFQYFPNKMTEIQGQIGIWG